MPRRESIRKLRKAAAKLDRKSGQRQMREVLRYASSSGRAGGAMRRGLRSLFGRILGDFVAELADVFAGGDTPRQGDVDDAIRLLQESGYNVQRARPGEPDPPPQTRQYGPLARPAPARGKQPGPPPPAIPADPVPPVSVAPPPGTTGGKPLPDLRRILQVDDGYPDEHTIDTRKLRAVMDPGAGIWATEIETPESSNVHSFAYDEDEGILYVTYKAEGKAVNGKRPHVRGAMYFYGGRKRPVPASVYTEMRNSSSRGKFVWDRLRVRGTIWGHQYPYGLASPSMGNGSIYVPRKATRRGLRVRNVATVAPVRSVPVAGQRRRRPTDRSNLPERIR